MSIRLTFGIVLFCVSMIGCAIANFSMHEMINEIKRSIHSERTFSHFGFWAGKNIAIVNEYRRLCPQGKLYGRMLIGSVMLFAGMVGVAICMMVRFR
jgi:hypothetical protein